MLISLTVNGRPRQAETDPRTLLLHLLREDLGLRGTKYGCGEGECGSCTVILNGRPVNACLTTAGQAHHGQILTIEGLEQDNLGTQVVQAFAEAGAVQCGFCTPGFILSAWALLANGPISDTETIQQGLGGNLCRCTGYTKIIKAVTEAALKVQPDSASKPAPVSRVAIPANGTFARPTTLDEALHLLAETGWRILAGGTDLLVQNEHRLKSLKLLDLHGLEELHGIQEDDQQIRIGALTTYHDLYSSAVIQRWAPALAVAAREVGGRQIQNMGTVGGNLVNASPAADAVPPLYVLDAQVVLSSIEGTRTIAVAEFFVGPGQTVIKPNELLTEIVFPKQQFAGQEITFFDKVGPRKAQMIAKSSIAFRGWLDDGHLSHVRLALGAVAPTVIRATRTENALMSKPLTEVTLMAAADVAHDECSPIDDIRSTATYRRRLVRGLLIRNLWPFLKE